MLAVLKTARRSTLARATKGFGRYVTSVRPNNGVRDAYVRCTKMDFQKIRYKQQICGFRTAQTLHIPPIFILYSRPVLRLFEMLLGRWLRKWWALKPKEEREMFKRWLRQRSYVLFGSIGVLASILLYYYVDHMKYNPISKRRQFIMLDEKQEEEISKFVFDQHLKLHPRELLPVSHPAYKRLERVVKRLVNANQDLAAMRGKRWTLTVVNSPEPNAYVLPGGKMFVYLGSLHLAENDDQLGIILAHEMAHTLLHHMSERASNGIIFDILVIIPIVLVWSLFPVVLAAAIHIMGQQLISVIHSLPYSRALENEADDVGLMLAAKACMDVREAPVFWAMVKIFFDSTSILRPVPWLSTHPDPGQRAQRLNEAMPKFIELRKISGCPDLTWADPRKKFHQRTLEEKQTYLVEKRLVEKIG